MRCAVIALCICTAVGDTYGDHSPHAPSLVNARQAAYLSARHAETTCREAHFAGLICLSRLKSGV